MVVDRSQLVSEKMREVVVASMRLLVEERMMKESLKE
jgi:hypothetical protein